MSRAVIAVFFGRRRPPDGCKPFGARPTGCRSNPILLGHLSARVPSGTSGAAGGETRKYAEHMTAVLRIPAAANRNDC